jgi:hypothetical protein
VVLGPENRRVVPSFSLVEVERSWVKPAPIRSIEQEAANEESWGDSRVSSGHVVTWAAAPELCAGNRNQVSERMYLVAATRLPYQWW